jgi:hypothetical protein
MSSRPQASSERWDGPSATRLLCQRLEKSLPKPSFEAVFDIGTCAISLADIGCDIAVAVEFHQGGHTLFLALSLAIFGIAQCAYSFLFVVSYGSHLSNRGKAIAFFAALPFSQLVPSFNMIESLHMASVTKLLAFVGLRESSAIVAPSDSDTMWVLVQRKYHAHAGFLLEALIEAIPQCALQLCFVVATRQVTPLNVFSIATAP